MKRLVCTIVGLMLLGVPAGLDAQDTEWNRYTLAKIGGVYVSVVGNPTCESVGVRSSEVRASAAIKLLESEVDLLTEDEMLENPGLPELRITLQCVVGDQSDVDGAIAYSIEVRVNQAAKMVRDEQVTLPEAVTWYTTAVGVANADDTQQALHEIIDVKLEEFAKAYVEANAEEVG